MRPYEVLVNQVISTKLELTRERKSTQLDSIYNGEKLKLIVTANDLNEIRRLRNQIVPEYLIKNGPSYIKTS